MRTIKLKPGKFRVGDRVRIDQPKDPAGSYLVWCDGMPASAKLHEVDETDSTALTTCGWWVDQAWLTKPPTRRAAPKKPAAKAKMVTAWAYAHSVGPRFGVTVKLSKARSKTWRAIDLRNHIAVGPLTKVRVPAPRTPAKTKGSR